MLDINNLLELTKSIAVNAGQRLLNDLSIEHKKYVHSDEFPKEVKALADTVLEQDILKSLSSTGFPILSEEAGYISGQSESKYWFIVDPLDGTFNFIKGLGPCAVSIAFWEEQKPIFGVIYDIYSQELYWGGEKFGAYCNGNKISVSNTLNKKNASICTGFPVRFNTQNNDEMQNFWNLISPYAKVRMLGTAAISLINVAKGSADVYTEQSIMLWDVAAGIAIIEGSGGCIYSEKGPHEYSLNVFASNKPLFKYH
jgi:myo-inositol-1(or 4)-monophosphatase